jgi:predicted nucleotidyltransferase
MTTALELTRKELKKYEDSVRELRGERILTPEEQTVREDLFRKIGQASNLLKSRFGAKKVWLFGSLAHQAWFTLESDVDLAVEGLQSGDYWEAWRAVEDIILHREVDLIEIETASNSLRKAIERYGVNL